MMRLLRSRTSLARSVEEKNAVWLGYFLASALRNGYWVGVRASAKFYTVKLLQNRLTVRTSIPQLGTRSRLLNTTIRSQVGIYGCVASSEG